MNVPGRHDEGHVRAGTIVIERIDVGQRMGWRGLIRSAAGVCPIFAPDTN